MPTLYLIAGCNGAGKTTASFTLLPDLLGCREFVNADEIARGLSPFQPETVAFEAGRIMLRRVAELLSKRVDFGIETTLSTKSYAQTIRQAQAAGYSVSLLYFWLSSPEMAIQRVEERVRKGGHHIPPDVVRRRYRRGIYNLFHLFIPLCDDWLVVDNTQFPANVVARGSRVEIRFIAENEIWNTLVQSSYE